MILINLLQWLTLQCFLIAQSAHIVCEEEYSCTSTNLTTTDEGDQIYCDGWKACTDSILSSGRDVWSSGAFSAYKSQRIVAIDDLHCMGVGSCSNVPQIVIGVANSDREPQIECYGINSCHNSHITAQNWTVFCDGESSCQGSTITDASIVIIDGQYAGLNTTIISTSNVTDKLHVIFRAHYAGYNASVICQSGYTCNITCRSSSCIGINVDCMNGSICILSNDYNQVKHAANVSLNLESFLNATDAIVNDAISMDYDMMNIEHFAAFELINYYNTTCSPERMDPNILYCSDDDECKEETINNTNYSNAICCSGEESCEDSHIIVSTDSNIFCLGRDSCSRGVIDVDTTDNKLQVHCSGIFLVLFFVFFVLGVSLCFCLLIVFVVKCICINIPQSSI